MHYWRNEAACSRLCKALNQLHDGFRKDIVRAWILPQANGPGKGARAKNLRPPRNKMIREGYSFEMLDASLVPALVGNLRTVSDEWLSSKNAREKA